ncbi:ABC transporter ATP-binding protein [uncultured Ellagibacter sp.]|uniref:ABC transporter ATP-binding protein n=1 Tax=uncultured Ellagibacter sp. TaxID=2137580 RepID=UPI0025D58514|nr:ABC transporter ATP-binding protein [uncultured Ellagibacter sp.]
MSNLLEIRDANRQVSDSFSLRNANLSIGSGEIVGLVGANGAGKTTIIRAALGLLKLDSGYAALFGEPLAADTPDADVRRLRSRVGVVFDTCPYPSEITVSQVETCIKPAFPTWDNACFETLVARFGLEPKKKVKSLSRGMGMKLQLACALSHNADLLILDEATAGLDPLARDELLDELRDYASTGDRGVLLSSHITSDLERIADRVVGIDAGSIIFNIPREQITDMAGIAHCTFDQAQDILACVDGARVAKREFSCDVLVPNRFEFAEAFPEVPCDRASIDDYLHFILKGNN